MPEAIQVHNGRKDYSWYRGIVFAVAPELCVPSSALTSSIVSLIAFGFPGKFIMSVLPLNPAVWRESTAVGTCLLIAEQSLPVGERFAEELPAQISCLSRLFQG